MIGNPQRCGWKGRVVEGGVGGVEGWCGLGWLLVNRC